MSAPTKKQLNTSKSSMKCSKVQCSPAILVNCIHILVFNQHTKTSLKHYACSSMCVHYNVICITLHHAHDCGNSLPANLHQTTSYGQLKWHLKSYLFRVLKSRCNVTFYVVCYTNTLACLLACHPNNYVLHWVQISTWKGAISGEMYGGTM